MSPLEAVIRRALSDLSKARARGAVIGGLAVSARIEFRFTKDVDFALAVADDRDAERIVTSFLQSRYQLLSMLDQTATGRFATARLIPPGETESGAVVDLLFASCGIEPEVVAAAESVELFRGLRVPVATIGHLIALKVLSRDDDTRPQDIIDLRALIVEATEADLAMAREGLTLITERGYDRGKRLHADLDGLLARFRPPG
jgi:predicted nucleotidyltransferase